MMTTIPYELGIVAPAPEFESESRDPQSLRISKLPHAGNLLMRTC